tara:strand:+ start:5044 stop:5226 length:183 start_codon:yes stop_codon:yes gene_type:complete
MGVSIRLWVILCLWPGMSGLSSATFVSPRNVFEWKTLRGRGLTEALAEPQSDERDWEFQS